MNKSGLFKRGVFLVLAVAVMAILMACLNFLISLFGVGISMPPNVCDLKAGFEFYPGSDDMLVGSRDLCLLRLGSTKASAQICNEIREYFMQLECIREVALQKKDPELCREFRSRKNPPVLIWNAWNANGILNGKCFPIRCKPSKLRKRTWMPQWRYATDIKLDGTGNNAIRMSQIQYIIQAPLKR